MKVAITYAGTIHGYEEVMPYVKDRISESYSLIRPDALAYPMLATAEWNSRMDAYRTSFTYDLTVRVPAGYVVACGGDLAGVSQQKGTAVVVHTFRSKIPTWRMDIAVAKFRKHQDESARLAVYALPEDEPGAAAVLKGMKRVIDLQGKLFGPPPSYQGYTAIEIPDGWGSQAGDYYFLQRAAAFRDAKNMHEVYHEIANTWNAKAKPGVDRCRWFDEAFATYFDAMALREIEGQAAFVEQMTRLRENFVSDATKNPKNAEVPGNRKMVSCHWCWDDGTQREKGLSGPPLSPLGRRAARGERVFHGREGIGSTGDGQSGNNAFGEGGCAGR